jgi:hypothetical protein
MRCNELGMVEALSGIGHRRGKSVTDDTIWVSSKCSVGRLLELGVGTLDTSCVMRTEVPAVASHRDGLAHVILRSTMDGMRRSASVAQTGARTTHPRFEPVSSTEEAAGKNGVKLFAENVS